ncbi:amidohydrolase [Xaviernesmea oryzae]|uniref:Amidohydrolase n=1 Tax=Xaviernesmea oryzae TaxID=464029 RepID=A0A1Q9B0Z3_9HYPH|nr:amidohydrolase family protein [Xaviernesmea oryzae]OLP61618.1 amidohydrolase [Xaviernesmea oryzae]SEL06210.1 cytosine deaminase [Xaviernesmea oryzae]
MIFDLLIRRSSTASNAALVDIAVKDGLIAAIAPDLRCEAVETVDAGGAFAFPGFVESHIHLDKAGILGRCTLCDGTLAEAVRETARVKAGFTPEDVYARAAHVVERAIIHGTTRMRSFVEVDPRAGFRSLEALFKLKSDYAFALDIEICAFAQEGLTQEPATFDMLDEALASGADLVGGCPYTDPDPQTQIERIFTLARRHDVAVDFHLDFSLDPGRTDLPAVIEATRRHGWGGRVSIGHVTNLSALPPEGVRAIAARLAEAGIALTVLPATDLFLNGRTEDRLVPRGVAPAHVLADCGVTTTIASNNILNPFTPYGDASLLRMANLYANLAQLARDDALAQTFDMISSAPARLMGRTYGLHIGAEATIVLLDCTGPADAVREIPRVIGGWKKGRPTFWNGLPQIFRPG